MNHFESFIEFSKQTPHDDAFRILGRGIDSRVWLSRDSGTVIKEYNTCHTRLTHETLLQYHTIQSNYAADIWHLHIDLDTSVKLLWESVRYLSLQVLCLPIDAIYHTNPTKTSRSWLLSEIPFIPWITFQEAYQQDIQSPQDFLQLESQVKLELKKKGVPLYISPENPGFALTRENIRVEMINHNEAQLMITDLGCSINEMVRTVRNILDR